jgi:hypothetical protein
MKKCQFPQSFGNTDEHHETCFGIDVSVVYPEYAICVVAGIPYY